MKCTRSAGKKRTPKMSPLMVSAANKNEGSRRSFAMRNALLCCCLCLFLLPFTPSIGAADDKEKENATQLEEMTVLGIPYSTPATPLNTRYGTQYNLVTEEQIRQQNAYDFQSTLRDVPGVMFQSKNLMGSQTSHSLYIRGRGASHPSSDFTIEFDGVPRFGALFGQVLGDSIAVSTIGGVEVFKSPQPSEFGSGYAMVNVLPKYMRQEGQEMVLRFSGGSYATFDESLAAGIKKGPVDFYASQSWASTDGHVDHSRAQQQNYYVNTGYAFNDEWNIRLLANYVSGQTLAPMPDIAPTSNNGVSWPMAERFDTETFLSTLTLNHHYERFNGFLKAYINDTNFDLLQELTDGQRYADGTGGLWSRQEIRLYGVRAKEKIVPWTGGEFIVGVDLDMTDLTNTERTYNGLAVQGINGGLGKRVWDYPDTTLFSPYLAVSQLIGNPNAFHLIPSAGVRYFNHNEFEDKVCAQAGLVIGYKHTDLNFNYARGVNYPSPVAVMNLALAGSSISDPQQYWKDIKPEVVDHYEASITHTWPETASLGATGFIDKGKDRFRTYFFGPIPSQFNDPIGEYEIRGLELTGKVSPVKTLELFAGATWLDVEATGNNGVEQDHMPYTPGFQLQAGLTWTFLEHFCLFMDMQYLRDLYQGTNGRPGGFNFSKLGDSDKLDDITVVNARLSYRLEKLPPRWRDSEIFLAVNNLFDADYEYAKGYSMPGTTAFAGFTVKFD
jgi:outer membrane cobalamin receptor